MNIELFESLPVSDICREFEIELHPFDGTDGCEYRDGSYFGYEFNQVFIAYHDGRLATIVGYGDPDSSDSKGYGIPPNDPVSSLISSNLGVEINESIESLTAIFDHWRVSKLAHGTGLELWDGHILVNQVRNPHGGVTALSFENIPLLGEGCMSDEYRGTFAVDATPWNHHSTWELGGTTLAQSSD